MKEKKIKLWTYIFGETRKITIRMGGYVVTGVTGIWVGQTLYDIYNNYIETKRMEDIMINDEDRQRYKEYNDDEIKKS